MRVLVPALVFAALSLSGCAGYELEGFVPPEAVTDGNTTMVPIRLVQANSTVAPVEDPAYPEVAGIAVAGYTAPVAIELDRVESEAATLSLVADQQGLRCVAVPHRDPMGSPAGYKAVASWARCSLSVGDAEFTSGSAPSMQADIPMMQGIPVEAFTWNMTVGRVLVNNTGEHEEVLDEVVRDQDASPSVRFGHAIQQWGILYGSSNYVCDTFLRGGDTTLSFVSSARNGRAALSIDTLGFDVWSVEGPGDYLGSFEEGNLSANATAAIQNATGAVWWQEGPVLHALGAWTGDSVAQLDLMMYFRGQGGSVALVPPRECPDALFRDDQYLPFEAQAIGVAAGWVDEVEGPMRINVWHTL